mgnify:CR=1 FL=1
MLQIIIIIIIFYGNQIKKNGLNPGVQYTLTEKDRLGDWSPEKDFC